MRGLVWLLAAGSALAARDYEGEINALVDARKAGEAQPLLDEWKAHGGERDAEYFVAAANVWHEVARRTVVEDLPLKPGLYEVGKKRPDGFIVRDPKSKKAVGSMRFVDSFDEADQGRAYAALEEATRRFPARLDIPIGLAYLHREAKDSPGELQALRAAVVQARALKQAPLWGKKPLSGSVEEFGLTMLNQYAREHFEAGDETIAKSIGELTVELFPDKPHGYNLISHYYADVDQFETVKLWLDKALAHAPEDSLVLANLADCEERLGHKKEALALYRRIISLNNDPQAVELAKRALKKRK